MTPVQGIEAVAIVIALGAFSVAALKDLREYRIPNTTVLCVAAAFALYAAAQGSWSFVLWSTAAGVATLAVCAVLFSLRLMGGGDAKLIAAATLWTQFAGMPRFLVVMALAGGLLSMAYLLKARLARRRTTPDDSVVPDNAMARRVPYGVAISAAGFDLFLAHPLSPLAKLIG